MLLSWVIWHLGQMIQNNHKMGHFYPFLFSFKTSLPFFFLLWFSLLYATYLSLSLSSFFSISSLHSPLWRPTITLMISNLAYLWQENILDFGCLLICSFRLFIEAFWMSYFVLSLHVYVCISYFCPNIFHFFSVSMGMFLLF